MTQADAASRDSADMSDEDLAVEFDRQVEALLAAGHAREAGVSEAAFRESVSGLRHRARALGQLPAPTRDRVPFVLVTTGVPAARAMELTHLNGRSGVLNQHARDIARFLPIEAVRVPGGGPYLLVDVHRGAEYRDVTPDDALARIEAAGRSPLTVAEGIALVTVHPEMLETNHCFSLAGSRCGDRRVPALWISGKAPMLGWCWAGNPHSWLGTAHAAGRTAG